MVLGRGAVEEPHVRKEQLVTTNGKGRINNGWCQRRVVPAPAQMAQEGCGKKEKICAPQKSSASNVKTSGNCKKS